MPEHSPTHFRSDTQLYTLHRHIGKGGFGQVYEVVNEAGEHFALKVIELEKQVPDEAKGNGGEISDGI